ncbi:MAG TPA: HAMP domain-containing sensor histidine kinase [Verrucomicrobiae bacterium]|jgi:signal transduction histidine kinase
MQNGFNNVGENARLRGDLLTMATRVSHDLRTPLGGIMTATEVLREILAEKNLPVTLTHSISDSLDDLTHLIKQISFITRASAEPLPKTPVRMNEAVAMAFQRVESRALKKNATIVDPGSWPQVNGVSKWLEEIWWNLLMNAIQHTADNTRIELTWREENGLYRFEVCDNGGGVPEIMQKCLFRPFHTLHRPEGGKGFGLSIVQRLIELQGGVCGYESRPGGSCFFFSLPI